MKFRTSTNVISCVEVQWENPYEVLKFFFLEIELLKESFSTNEETIKEKRFRNKFGIDA